MKTKWLRPSEALSRRFYHPTLDERDTGSDEVPVIRRLGFQVGELNLLIGENVISELTDIPSLCPIPNTAAWMLGVGNLRGNLFPVFELTMLVGMEHKPKAKQMLLILGQGDAAAGVIIDGLPAHQILAETDRLESLPALPSIIRPYVSSAYEKAGNIWFVFDHDGFFSSLGERVAN
jgi:twitching motility protein PilI